MRAINVTAVERLMAVARECGVKAFVHTSSANTIFDGKTPFVDMTEDMPYPKPSDCIDLYSVTKAEAERLVTGSNGKDGMYTACTRPNGIWGPSERCVGVRAVLESCAPMGGYYTKFLDASGKEPLVDWCHVENLALIQMLAAKQLLAQNERVCGSIYNASDDVVGTYSEFFGEIARGAGWSANPVLPLPAWLLQRAAYCMEAACYGIRNATGWRGVVAPLNCVEAAKCTMDNYQNVGKAKRDLGFVAIPQGDLMKGMAAFSQAWIEKYARVPDVPLQLWATILPGMAATLAMSFADTKRFGGAPWRAARSLMAKAVPGLAAMPLDVFQRKVFRIGICLPMLGVHFLDGLLAAYLARKQSHRLWTAYSLRTMILGFGQLRHLLSERAAGPYGVFVAAAFCASGLAAAKVK